MKISEHPASLLAPYALGTLPYRAARRVDAHLRGCRACTDQLRDVYEAQTLMALSRGEAHTAVL